MKNELTLNDMTILGLLQEEESGFTGKELEKIVEDRNMRNWTKIGKSTIYSNLKKLEKKKYVNFQESFKKNDPNFPPIREKYYSLTTQGKSHLESALYTTLSTHKKIIDPFDISLAYLFYLTPEKRKKAIDERLEQILQRKIFLEKQCELSQDPIVFLLFSKPLYQVKAEEEWITTYYDQLTK